VVREADLLCINLECAPTRETQRWRGHPRKAFFFRADPAAVEVLRAAGVRFAGLANNHIGDFDTAGLLETIAVLDSAGIAHAGAGADLDAARAPAVLATGADIFWGHSAHLVQRVELVPVQIQGMQVTRATGVERKAIVHRLTTFCREMGTELVESPDGRYVVHRRVPAPP